MEALPTNKEKKLQAISEQREVLNSYNTGLSQAMESVAQTKEGVMILKHLFRYCNPFSCMPKVSKEGELLPINIAYDSGVRDVYLHMRQFLAHKTLEMIER